MQDLFKKQFKALKDSSIGIPDKNWKNEFRSTLMMQAKNTVGENPRVLSFKESVREFAAFIFPVEQMQFAARTLTVMVLAAGLVFGGSITTVSASLNSVPGDLLYSLKRITEEAQVALANGGEVKAELHLEFAGRRVQEVVKINDNDADDGAERITQAVESFKQEIATANQYMEDLKDDSEKVVQVAKSIDAKTEMHQQILTEVEKNTTNSATLGVVAEAKAVAEDASVKAVEVLIINHESASSTISTEELKDTVENKINDIEKKVDALEPVSGTVSAATSTPTAGQAKTAILDARESSLAGDFAGALSKIKESSELVRAVTALTVITNASSNTSTTAVLGSNSSTPASVESNTGSGAKFKAQGAGEATSTPMQIQSLDNMGIDETSSTPRIIQ